MKPDQDDALGLAKLILEMIMEQKLKFYLSQSVDYRKKLEEEENRLCFLEIEKKASRKKKARLRKKLRRLNHETANIFHSDFFHVCERYHSIVKSRIHFIIEIQNECVMIHIYRHRYGNIKCEIEEEIFSFFNQIDFVKIGSISSDEVTELLMIPFLIRYPEYIIFHKESSYVAKNF